MLRGMARLAMLVASGLATAGPAGAQPGVVIDCQESFDCFVQASVTCTPARVWRTSAISGSGMVVSGTIYFEIRGLAGDRCVYYQRQESASVRYDEETHQRWIGAGLTEDQVRGEEEQASQRYAAFAVGQDGSCRLPQRELTALLIRMLNAEFVPVEEYQGSCEGPVFGPRAAGGPTAVERPAG